jgi:hypothetical protein
MPMTPVPAVSLTPVAYFPEKYFLENLAVRADGSVLITAVLQKELWLVPGPEPRLEVPPVLMHTFEFLVMGIVEIEPDVFVISLTDGYTTHESHLARIDLNGWTPGEPLDPEIIYTFTDDRVRALNGNCLLPFDPTTLDPAGDAQFVAAVDNADDFCLDEDAGFAYVTRHRANTLDRVPLAPRHGSEVRHLAGDPFNPVLAGPSSAYWGRRPGEHGRVAYVTTDGGTTAPPDGIIRNAALLRVQLHPATGEAP